ncbi:hypothetical protein SRB5_44570 [Streptomyces sp. RB5]|uniref:Uncharacterized protein n=1 Tax=Streptomyces smaragdinus TaxID=2585196 RepID=A0A7K0CM03_9ACTN|nr:hypothetical protein [Streptomyces smaragdinus]MQY14293.1 hypothetical protein [Streptomyces smaragdinus]
MGHRGYADIRPYMVPGTLGALVGPVTGVVELPTALDWGPKRAYRLDSDSDRRVLYETVIREAARAEQLAEYLNAGLLVRLWPRLWLPPQVKRLWLARFPELGPVLGPAA